MKSTVLLITTLLFSCIISSQGQTVEEFAELAAEGLCTCVDETYSAIEKDVKRAMARIIKYQMQGNEEEMENYMAKLSANLIGRIEKQASIFEANDDLFQMCLDDMEDGMGALSFNDEEYHGITEDEFLVLMIASMKEVTDCEFAYILIELGMKMEAEEGRSQVKVNPVESKKSTRKSKENYQK